MKTYTCSRRGKQSLRNKQLTFLQAKTPIEANGPSEAAAVYAARQKLSSQEIVAVLEPKGGDIYIYKVGPHPMVALVSTS